jgi:hypothetical protein
LFILPQPLWGHWYARAFISSLIAFSWQCGLRIIIQSNSRDPLYLDDRIESFLSGFDNILQNLSSEDFEHNRQAVIESLLEKPKNINSVRLILSSSSFLLPFPYLPSIGIQTILVRNLEKFIFV